MHFYLLNGFMLDGTHEVVVKHSHSSSFLAPSCAHSQKKAGGKKEEYKAGSLIVPRQKKQLLDRQL